MNSLDTTPATERGGIRLSFQGSGLTDVSWEMYHVPLIIHIPGQASRVDVGHQFSMMWFRWLLTSIVDGKGFDDLLVEIKSLPAIKCYVEK